VSEGGLDLIVVGLGAAGAATLHQAARRGARVLGLDRHHPPHDQGSSHGESRITRQAIGEGLDYVPLAMRSHALWREIEAETGETLIRTVGALMISAPNLGAVHHGKHDFLEQTIDAARAFGIDHELLEAAEIRTRYPQFAVRDHERAYFEPGAGILYPERCIAAQLMLARHHGASIRSGEAALAIEPVRGGVRIVTDTATYETAAAVVCAGAWTGGLLGGTWARALTLHRQSLYWFEPDDPAAFAPERFPVFIWMHGAGEGDWFYGFPRDAQLGGVKIASEQFAQATASPDELDRTATRDEALAAHARHVTGRIQGLPPAWLRSTACVYTDAPQSRFVIGPDPAREKVIVVSACSGHGFKHSPAIGEAVASWVLDGAAPKVLAPFSPERLARETA
jgi:sarcosine oxidase